MVTHQAWTLKDNVERIFYMKDGEIIRIEKETPKVTEVVKKIGSSYYYKKLFTGLPRANVYAQILSSLILRGYSRPEIKRLEELIYKRLRREIDKKLFKELLDKPFQEGGVGLWRQKAERVANYVESVTKKRKELKKIYKELEKNPEDPLFEEVAKLQNWLFEDYKMRLSSLQKSRLREAISGRIKNIILPEHLIKIFDLPIEEGGVGLKIGTALKMGEKLEILLGRKEVSLERM